MPARPNKCIHHSGANPKDLEISIEQLLTTSRLMHIGIMKHVRLHVVDLLLRYLYLGVITTEI